MWGWLDPDHADLLAGKPALEAWLAKRLGLDALTATPPLRFDASKVRKSKLTDRMRRSLIAIVGNERLTEAPLERASQLARPELSRSAGAQSGRIAHIADAVVLPESADEVVSLLAAAGRNGFGSERAAAAPAWSVDLPSAAIRRASWRPERGRRGTAKAGSISGSPG